jgi:hypothetical protein
MTDTKYPEVKVKLLGEDGNAFMILGRCRGACKTYLPRETWETVWNEFKAEATSGNYDHLLCTAMDFFTCDEEEDEENDDDN